MKYMFFVIMLAFLSVPIISITKALAQEQKWLITAYCPCVLCCGKDVDDEAYGITASGERAKVGYCASKFLPFGTTVDIGGLGRYVVMDRGLKDKYHIDIFFNTHQEALNFGVQYRTVEIVQ